MSLSRLLVQHANRQSFIMGIGIMHLASSERASVNGDVLFPMASTMNSPAAWSLRDRGGGFRDRSRRFLAH